MSSLAKTRFAPSPTGFIHLGNARTALFSALFAAGQKGTFLLRIEDTDVARSKSEYIDALQVDLNWLGAHANEGVGAKNDGGHGPYFQSKRSDIYASYYQTLADEGRAYPCFCSEEQLAISRKLQRAAGRAPRYAGTCRGLSADEVQTKFAQGLKAALRFKMPENKTVNFDDLVKGKQRFASNDIGDFIIRRADGGASFMFCNAIDDSLMKVTHVLRGEDHLTNTPRQLAILDALGLDKPQYGHISLILGSDGAPLSKRNGSRSVQDLRGQGYLALAVVNYLARLGHYYEKNELLSLEHIAEYFKLESLSSSPARFDEAQLNYWQKQAVFQVTLDDLWEWLPAKVKGHVPSEKRDAFLVLVQANCTFPDEALRWARCLFDNACAYDNGALEILKATPADLFAHAIEAVDQYGTDFKAIANTVKTALDIKGKALFQPLRIALTGQIHGPEMTLVAELLGVDEIKQRLDKASQQ